MKELDKTKVYSLEDLTSEERKQLSEVAKNPYVAKECELTKYLIYANKMSQWQAAEVTKNETTNAKELFYTLENIQVDCRELSKNQINEMVEVFKSKGYDYFESNKQKALIQTEELNFLHIYENQIIIDCIVHGFNEITYEKFMELFGDKGIEETNDKPKHYSKGIDTFARMEANCTKEEIFNPQQHYFNELRQFRSLFELSHVLGLNEWEFDILKRLVRCRKKGQFKEDLQKIKDTVDIYLNEFTDEKQN